MTKVSEMLPGQCGSVCRVDGAGAVRQRLLDIGIMPRSAIKVERIAPAGGPILIDADGLRVALRRAEASMVLVA